MSVRQPTAIVVASAFIAGALSMVGWAVGSPGGSLLMAAAHAEAAQKNRAEQLRSQVVRQVRLKLLDNFDVACV